MNSFVLFADSLNHLFFTCAFACMERIFLASRILGFQFSFSFLLDLYHHLHREVAVNTLKKHSSLEALVAAQLAFSLGLKSFILEGGYLVVIRISDSLLQVIGGSLPSSRIPSLPSLPFIPFFILGKLRRLICIKINYPLLCLPCGLSGHR
jgi:hypothetical protein